ncbi:MAG: OmpA family protein [Pseudomonadota bacterium]
MNRKSYLLTASLAFVLVLSQGCVARCLNTCEKIVKVTTLDGIHFDFDKSTIRPDGKPILDEDVAMLEGDSDLIIRVEGYTDNFGTPEYNMKLGENRAKTVYDYFREMGVSPTRMTTMSFGESNPVLPNTTEANRAKNRRIEVKIIKKQ